MACPLAHACVLVWRAAKALRGSQAELPARLPLCADPQSSGGGGRASGSPSPPGTRRPLHSWQERSRRTEEAVLLMLEWTPLLWDLCQLKQAIGYLRLAPSHLAGSRPT